MVMAEASSLVERRTPKTESVPEALVKEKNAFIERTRATQIQVMSQASRPKDTWRIFYARTYQDAADVAHLTAWEAARGKPVKKEWEAAIHSEYALRNTPFPAIDSALMAGWHATLEAADKAGRGKTVREVQHAFFGPGDQFAFDVGLMAGLILVKDLDFEGKERYLKHAAERMEVWERGYGLSCDVNGKLYVYAATPYRPERPESHLRGKQV
jgi:hypothetical protein